MAFKGLRFKHKGITTYQEERYEIGDLYLTTRSENPSTRFGGTWELFGPGRTLVCVDINDPDFNTVKKTTGEKTHKITINELPSHGHTIEGILARSEKVDKGIMYRYDNQRYIVAGGKFTNSGVTQNKLENPYETSEEGRIYSHNIQEMLTNSLTGNSQSHNNLQP